MVANVVFHFETPGRSSGGTPLRGRIFTVRDERIHDFVHFAYFALSVSLNVQNRD